MAEAPYNEGLPSVVPSGDLPSDYINVQDKVGASLQRFGAGLVDAGTAFTQASSDNAFNLYQTDVSNILRGKPATDGNPSSDLGYLGLNGKDALDARPSVEKQIADLRKKYGSDLASNPVAQNLFDQQAGRYENSTFGMINSHASDQSKVWYTQVNQASEDNAKARIAASPLDPKTIGSGAADIINAKVKQAQLLGAQPGDELYTAAVADGKREALKAQVLAIGTEDPSSALRILQKNQAIAGTDYDELYTNLRARADEQDGYGAADAALKDAADQHATSAVYTNPALPIYQETAANIPGGMSAAGLARTVQIESGGNPTIANASDHVGLGQFSADTAKEVGITDRTDPNQSIEGIQRYAAQNAPILAKALGRPPTDAELYLAHQQGATGAAKLLANPTALASSIVGAKAVIQNGGRQDMTAAEYVAMWTHKFGGTAPVSVGQPDNRLAPSLAAAPAPQVVLPQGQTVPQGEAPVAPSGMQAPNLGFATIKANAMQAVLDDPNLTPRARAIAITRVNQQYAAMASAEQESAAAKKAASDQASDQYVTKMLTGDTAGLADAIARDPNLDGDKKLALTNAMLAHADSSVAGATAAYGEGFFKARQQILAPVGDPSRISDTTDILRRAQPGGDLTLAGANKLIEDMTKLRKSVDNGATTKALNSLEAYAKSKLSNQRDGNPLLNDPGHKDPVGEAAFNSTFIPKFEAAFDAWIAAGKNPWEFLTKENTDKMMQGIRDPQEVAMQNILGGVPATQSTPAPEGVDQENWDTLTANVPPTVTVKYPGLNWAAVLQRLAENPTPQAVKWFDTLFADGAPGYSAKNVLDALWVEIPDTPKEAPKPAENPDYPGAHPVINGVEDLGLALPVQ